MAGFCLLTIAMVGCGAKTASVAPPSQTEAVAATVNGEPISMDLYTEHTGTKQTAQILSERGAASVRVLGSFGLQSLQELVEQEVLLQMAKDAGVAPTDADIDAELKFQTQLQPAYESLLHDQGLTDPMIRRELRVGLAREHLVMKGVTVSESDVDQYIRDHPDKFEDPAKASILFIQVGSASKKAMVDAALASHKAFAAVAGDFSDAPNAGATQGVYPINVISQMPKPFQDIVNSTAEKTVTDWKRIGSSFFKFYIVKKTPAAPKTPSTAERELVRRQIGMQRGQALNDFDHKFYTKLLGAKVDVRIPYLQTPWTKSWNQLAEPGGGLPNSRGDNR